MALKKKPVTGMKDILPREMELRQYVLSEIRRTYKEFGFTEIETPIVEHIENLLSKQGGDNEKLIFKVQKRGDKLESAFQSGNLDALADSGLRYDLTLTVRIRRSFQVRLRHCRLALFSGRIAHRRVGSVSLYSVTSTSSAMEAMLRRSSSSLPFLPY